MEASRGRGKRDFVSQLNVQAGDELLDRTRYCIALSVSGTTNSSMLLWRSMSQVRPQGNLVGAVLQVERDVALLRTNAKVLNWSRILVRVSVAPFLSVRL